MLDDFVILENLTEKQISGLMELYKNEDWTNNRKTEDVKLMLENSHVIALVNSDNDEIIAFTRFLSDLRYRAMVYDVIVSEKYRGKGYGRIILETLVNHQMLKNVEKIDLYCDNHNVKFYEKFGFEKYSVSTNFMTMDSGRNLEVEFE